MEKISVEEICKLLPHGKNCFLYLPNHIEDVELHTTEGKPAIQAIFHPSAKHFQGHFPNFPVYPAVLQLEAIMQLGAILIKLETNTEKKIIPIGITEVRFFKFVTPEIKSLHLQAILDQIFLKDKTGQGQGRGFIYIEENGKQKLVTKGLFKFILL